MFNQVKIALQYLLPKQRLTQLAGWAAEKNAGALTHWVIRLFARHYGINMQEAQKSDLSAYASFNEFFTRPLKHSARPIDFAHNCLCLPADGMISQIGPLRDDLLLQAKGHYYSLDALLAGQTEWVRRFRHGAFATTYLSPRDYHRVHMPCDGTLREMIYVPGELFSVNPLTAENVPGLFARNERVICLFDTAAGPMAQILVGATIVGSIETVWSGTVTPPREGIIKRWTWPAGESEGSVALLKGQEMGRFKLGSTVINLFAPGQVKLVEQLQSLSVTKIGQPLAIAPEAVTPVEPAPLAAEEVRAEHAASSLVDDKQDEG